MARSIRVLSLFLFSFILNLAYAEYPGVTPGSFSVSDSGAANYNMPISTPAGVAGMSPDLAVTYNSSGGNGILGVGFSLSGFGSTIHRCGGSHATDGHASGVRYTILDKLCLDGQRLVLYSGTHFYDGAVYHTELESFAKIEYSNGQFTVFMADGMRREYHTLATASGTTLRWYLTSEKDRSGNKITYSYQHIDGEYKLPKEVRWTDTATHTGNRKAKCKRSLNYII